MIDLLYLIPLFSILFCGFFAIWFVKLSERSLKPLYTSLKAGKSEISELDSDKEVYAIEGEVKKHNKLIRSPFSGNKCVAYRTAYEEETEQGAGPMIKQLYSSDKRYTVMKEKIESVPFVIQDSTDEVVVDPDKDDIEVRMSGTGSQFLFFSGEKSVGFKTHEIYDSNKFEPPEEFNDRDQGVIDGEQRMIETRIEVGDTVTAFLSSEKEGAYTNNSDRRSSSYPEQIIDLPWTDAVNGLFRQSIYYLIHVAVVLLISLMFIYAVI